MGQRNGAGTDRRQTPRADEPGSERTDEDRRVDDAATSADYRDRDEALTGCSLRVCPRGHDGQMRIVERLIGAPTRPRMVDTS